MTAHQQRLLGIASLAVALTCVGIPTLASDPATTSTHRGYEALTKQAFIPPIWLGDGYQTAWKTWGLKEKPAEYDAAFRDRYGVHSAPYPNDGLPMGLRKTSMLFGVAKGITTDCMLCHAGSICGKSYIGLGNASLELEGLFTELAGFRSETNLTRKMFFPFSNVRGTLEAAAVADYVFSLRNEDLSLRIKPLDLGSRSDLCEDTPAWWHFKKKKRLYYNGSVDARSVRTLMVFALSPFHTLQMMKEMEPAFRDIQAYLKTIEPPKYPFAIDTEKAAAGKLIFKETCAKCHGTYGDNWTYPNKLVDLEEIGTDPNRAIGISSRAKAHYDKTWFGQETGPDGKRFETSNEQGYIAPPLDGIWATASYFHNGSVPTIYEVLNSKSRPDRFTRTYRTDEADYDKVKVGWKYRLVGQESDPTNPIEKRKIYDTTQPGRGNQGHTFGDGLTEEERWALIEYLKTL